MDQYKSQLTERQDNYVKGDAKMTNQKMAVVVQASVEPVIKAISEVKKSVQDLRMENNSQAVNFFRTASKKQDDHIASTNQQLQLVLNTVRNLLPARQGLPAKPPAPAAAATNALPYPAPQGQSFQGYQAGNGLAPTGFPGPPPTFQPTPTFNQAPPTFNLPANNFNQPTGPPTYCPAPINFNQAPPVFHPVYQPMMHQQQQGQQQQGQPQQQQPGSSHTFYQVSGSTISKLRMASLF